VQLFDRGRGTALHLFEHVHGDSRERGPAMVDLCKTYESAGLYLAPGELPDHLCVVLQYASTQPPAQARAFLGEVAHILQLIFSALLRREAAHACLLAALLDLAGEKAQAVSVPAEPGLDESWAEPAAFDGCSTQGQARPGQPQPIQIVKNPALAAGASRAAAQSATGASA
jgi:nitrate reductase delta subunit